MATITQMIRDRFRNTRYRKVFQEAWSGEAHDHFDRPVTQIDLGEHNRGLAWMEMAFFDTQTLRDDTEIWDLPPISETAHMQAHSFVWFDDLIKVGTANAEGVLKTWFRGWMERYGKGDGDVWSVKLAAQRLFRLVAHAEWANANPDPVLLQRYYDAVRAHELFVDAFIESEEFGQSRFIGLSALLMLALSFEEIDPAHVDDLNMRLDRVCSFLVEENEIAFPSRNTEELYELFSALVWTRMTLEARDIRPKERMVESIAVIARHLRALRTKNGGFVEVHGAGAVDSARLSRVLSQAKSPGFETDQPCYGFTNLREKTLHFIMDTDAPPNSDEGFGHASTNAIWVYENGAPIITSKGSARYQPLHNRIAAQETVAHSTLIVNNSASSELELASESDLEATAAATIHNPARIVDYSFGVENNANLIDCSHSGYASEYFVRHQRKISFDHDGQFFAGIDCLRPNHEAVEDKLKKLLRGKFSNGIPFTIQFLLGPDITPRIDEDGTTASFTSLHGTMWVFRQQGGRTEIIDSEIYDPFSADIIATKALIISTRMVESTAYVSWSFQAYPPD